MLNRISKSISFLCFLVLFIALISIRGPARAGQATEDIDQARVGFNTAFSRGDAQALAALIDKDGVWLPPGEDAISGVDNIVRRYAEYFSMVNTTIDLKPGDMQICGEFAFLSGPFTRTDSPKAGGPVITATGHYLFILKKQSDGKWKIARDIWNETIQP
ncbi:MAG: DUF4440 domain-containing protein [Pseudomonadota bacterium]